MNSAFRQIFLRVSRAQGSWLTLLLLLVVLVPSVCLIWFMTQAVRNERLAVRQKLVEAYRSHLSLARERLEVRWKSAQEQIESQGGQLSAPALFARLVRENQADAVICYDVTGKLVYPNSPASPSAPAIRQNPTLAETLETSDLAAAARQYARIAEQAADAAQAAMALQAQARCLLRADKPDEAIAVLTGRLAEAKYRRAADTAGRLLVPNAELMAIELLQASDPNRSRAVRDLLMNQLLDYDHWIMPASQRRFLMRELQRIAPTNATLSLLAAEDLAQRYVESAKPGSADSALRASALANVWQCAVGRGRIVILHRTENLRARLRSAAASEDLPAAIELGFIAPDQEAGSAVAAQPAGGFFPGWQLALWSRDPFLFDTASQQQVTAYLWIGALVVITIAALGLLAMGLVRRQMALAQLRNDLVANVTHELKTPLSSMRLLVETMLNTERLELPTVREYLQLIDRENQRLSRLIDNFLTFSRMERNKYALNFQRVPAATIAQAAVEAVRERFHTDGCRFDTQLTPDLPLISADADALVTVLINLLDNAHKYSGADKRITLASSADNGTVRFAVSDNGIGLSRRDMRRIFQRFYRVDQRLSRTTGGCGLGLSIVKYVVTAHRGDIAVDSQPGRGSTFTVTLPVAAAGQTEGNA